MSDILDRREFIRRLLALSASGAAILGVSGCRPQPETSVPTAPPATAQARQPGPSATRAASPTASHPEPTATAEPTLAAPATAAASPATATVAATATSPAPAYLAVARGAGADPGELTRRAVAAVGGIERFVKQGSDVIIKPNICVAYNGPEYASTTNPDVVAAVVALCLGAGAKRVRVMDFPFGGTAQAAYAKSGIADAVKAAGGQMELMSNVKYREIELPQAKELKKWKVYGDIVDADVVINIPIAKNHSAAGLTMGMKNLMGVVLDRNGMHARGLHQAIADVNSAVRPQLTIVDCVRILMANGPTGGSLDDVKRTDTVIASTDVVAADSYATTLFGMTGKDIQYIGLGAQMGLGQMDLNAIKIEEIAV